MNKSWQAVRKEIKIDNEFDEYLEHVGKPFNTILELLNIDKDKFGQIKEIYDRVSSKNLDRVRLYKGTIYVLKVLKKKGYKIGIVTSKTIMRTADIVDKLKIPVDILVTPEMTLKGKPSGMPVIYAYEKLKSKREETFYVGDMESDAQSAESANVKFIKAEWGYGKEKSKHIAIDNMMELLEYLGIS